MNEAVERMKFPSDKEKRQQSNRRHEPFAREGPRAAVF
jgi:hypothetical protein